MFEETVEAISTNSGKSDAASFFSHAGVIPGIVVWVSTCLRTCSDDWGSEKLRGRARELASRSWRTIIIVTILGVFRWW